MKKIVFFISLMINGCLFAQDFQGTFYCSSKEQNGTGYSSEDLIISVKSVGNSVYACKIELLKGSEMATKFQVTANAFMEKNVLIINYQSSIGDFPKLYGKQIFGLSYSSNKWVLNDYSGVFGKEKYLTKLTKIPLVFLKF